MLSPVHIPHPSHCIAEAAACLRRGVIESSQHSPIGSAENKDLALAEIAAHILRGRPHQEVGGAIAAHILQPSHHIAKVGVCLGRGVIEGT